jgi:hypothetical protein
MWVSGVAWGEASGSTCTVRQHVQPSRYWCCTYSQYDMIGRARRKHDWAPGGSLMRRSTGKLQYWYLVPGTWYLIRRDSMRSQI